VAFIFGHPVNNGYEQLQVEVLYMQKILSFPTGSKAILQMHIISISK
jgi:hypothetical protein